jgi:hypothetical protein
MAWGDAWGDAWGESWGEASDEEEEAVVAPTTRPALVICVDANAEGTETIGGDTGIRKGFRRGALMGFDGLKYGQAWDQWQTGATTVDTGGFARMVDEGGGCLYSVTIGIIEYNDDVSTQVPAALAAEDLDSATVQSWLFYLLSRIHAIAGARVWQIVLGQEVDGYLMANQSDITPYANLIAAAATYARGLSGWEDVEVTASVAYSATTDYATLEPVMDACTVEGWTYYFKNADLSFRDTNTVTMGSTFGEDLLDIFVANGVKPISLIELGCSSTGTDATPALQAHFWSVAFLALAAYGTLITGVVCNWKSDFNEDLMDIISPDPGTVRDWIKGIGWRTDADVAKAAYGVIAAQLQGADVTTMIARQQRRQPGPDANTRLRTELQAYSGSTNTDLTTLLAMYQNRVIG